jgi:hypothetical protein
MVNEDRAWALWSELKRRNPTPLSLLPILQKRNDRTSGYVWLYFLAYGPSKSDLMVVVEKVEMYRERAWEHLLTLAEPLSREDLIHLMETVESLQPQVWTLLSEKVLYFDQFFAVLKVAPDLREQVFDKLLKLRPSRRVLEALKKKVPAMTERVDSVLGRPERKIMEELLSVL